MPEAISEMAFPILPLLAIVQLQFLAHAADIPVPKSIIHGNNFLEDASLSDCFTDEPHNIVYRFEGYLPTHPGVRPGCEVEYNGGRSNHWLEGPFQKKILKYFVVEADGHEVALERNSAVLLSIPEVRSTRKLTWSQICFPVNCYIHTEEPGDFEESCVKPYWPQRHWILEWLFPNAATRDREARLGDVHLFSTCIYCQPGEKRRFPVYTTTTTFSTALVKSIGEFEYIDHYKHVLSYKYRFTYSPKRGSGEDNKHLSCDLKILLDSPGEVLRTFSVDYGAQYRRVVPAREAYLFGRKNNSGIQWTSKKVEEHKDLCFPSQCFPGEDRRCENGIDRKYKLHHFSAALIKRIEHSLFRDSEVRTKCEIHSVVAREGGEMKKEERYFCHKA